MGGDASLWNWTSNGNANILTFEDTTTKVVGMVNGEIFTVSIEDDFGCTNSASITITVNPKPTNVTSSPHGTYCSSDSPVNLSGGLPLGGYYAADNGINNNTYDPSSAGYGSAIVPVDIMYIWADANGCKDTVTAPINVQLAPEVNLYSPFLSLNPTDDDYMTVSAQTGGWSKCGSVDPTFTLDLELTNASIANNSANVTYDLDFGDGNSINNILPGVVYSNTYSGQGAYDIVVTATDNITACVRTYEKEFFYGTNPAVSLGTPGNTTGRCAPASYGFPVEFFTVDLATGDTTINSPGTSYLKFTNDGKDDSTFVHPSPKGDLVKSVINHSFDDASCGYSFAGQDNIFSIAITATNGCGSSSASVFPITQSSPPIAKIDSTDSIFCINVPVTFVDSSKAGKFVLSSWNGIGYDYSCDTIGATAWKITPNTGFTVTAGSLGTLPLDYYDSTTYGTPEITLTFYEKNTYSIALYKSAQCGGGISSDSTDYEFKIDTLPHAEFILDKDIDCGPFSVFNNNISLSKNDYNATFDWGFSTLINGCRGSTGPTIEKVLSDSSLVNQYYQNFDGMDNYGHDGVSSNLNLVNWTMDVSAANMVDVNDWFKIRNEKLEAQDINGTAIWYSPVVDISTYNMVSLELNAEESVINYSSNTNLEGHWEMDENSGLIAGDSSGNSRNATISGATWVAGKVGSALSFDGVDDEVIATGYKGILGSNSRTIAAWIKTSSAGAIAYWGENATGKKSALRLRSSNPSRGALRFEISGGNIYGTTDLRDNQWHHVCAVLPSGATNVNQVLLYVDGQLETIASTSPETINTASLDDFKIGNDGLNRYFNGLIDEVRLYSRALSIEEINDLSGFSNAIANPNEIKTEYRVDGGPWTIAESNGSLTGDFNAATITQDSVSGSILELKISMNTVDQIFTADNIKVSGYGNYDSLNSIYSFTKAGLYTIDLTATNVCGSDLYQDTVTVQGAPIVTIDPIIDTCDTKNLFPTATIDTCFGIMSGYSWTFPGSAANETSNLEVPNMIYYDSVGVFKTYIDVTNNCGSDQDSLSFEIHDDPVIDLKPIDSICFGLSTTLSPNVTEGSPNYIYSWSSNAFISNTSSSTPNISTNSDQNVYLEVTDDNSCKAFDTIFIDVQELPIVDAGTNQSVCPEDTAFLTGSISGAIPPYTFSWDLASLSDITILNPYYDMDGTETFTLTAVDSFGCTNNNSVIINERISPAVTAGQDTALCDQPIAVDFNGSPSGGIWVGSKIDNAGLFLPNGINQDTAIYQYTDVFGCYNEDTLLIDVQSTVLANAGIDFEKCVSETQIPLNGLPLGGYWNHVNINSQIFNVTQSDTLDLVYFYGSGNCLNNDTMNLVINPLPIVDPGNDFESCIDDADELLVPSVLGGTWSGNGITDPNGTFTPSTAGVGVHNLNYFFRDTNTCEITVPLQATVYALPIVLTQVDTVICDLPVDVALNASPSGGNWIDSNITNNGIYSPDGTGTFKIYYDYTDVNTCYNIDSMILTVNPAQISDAGPDIQACADTGLIMLNGLPPAAGNWFGSGVSLSGDYNVINPDTVNLVYNIGAGNCFTTDTMNLLIHPLPKITLDSSFQMCLLDEDTTIQFSPTGGLLDGTGILNSSTGVFSPSTAGVGIHKLVYSYQHPITGCWNYDSLEIDVQSLPTVNYTHDSIFCLNVGHPINNTTTTVQNHYWTISNGATSNLYSPVFNLNTVGFYDLNYIAETSAGCKDSMKTSFEVLAPPTASYSVPDSGCGPLLVDFTNNSTGKYVDYLWDLGFENHLGTDSISTDTVPSDQSYPASLYFDTTYYSSLTVTNVCGVATQNTEIISMPMPVSRFGLLSNVGDCLSGSVTLANNSYGLPDAYYWDFGDGTFGTNSDTIFDHYYAPGNGNSFFNIVMSVTNECGTDTTTETVTIAPSNLVAFFSVDTTVGCVPFTVDFNQFTVNGSNNQSWDFDDGNFSNLYSPSHTFTDSGTYQVSLAVSNACNFDTAYKTIRVNSSPNIEFNVIDDTLCAGSVFQFNNLSDNGISNNWDFGDSTYSYITNPTHIFTDSGNFRVILTGSSLTNNCEAYDSVDLVVLPYPVITATSDTSNGCIPLPVNFSSTVNSVGYYLWDFGDGNTSTVDNPTHTYTSDGYYSVNVRFEDFSGCVDSFDFDIIPHPVPSPSFIPIQLDTCVLPINYNFQNNSIGASSYNWDFGDGNNSINTLPDNSYVSSGNYTIKLVASNTYGCSDSITSSIFVKPVTNAQFNAVPLDTCKLPANYSLVNNSTGSIAYIWDFGDGSTSNLPNLNHSYSSDGNYQISLISMNSFGCFDTSYVDINVLPVPSLGFNYTQLDTCSVPSNFSFQNTSTGGNSYLWDFGDGLFSPVYSPLHTFSSDGTYNVKISGSNIFGCSDSLVQPVIVNPIPVAQFTAIQLDTCVIPASFSLVNSSVGAIFNSWDLGNGASSNSTNFNYSYTSSGSYDISLLVMNQFGCLDSLTSSVNVSPVPQVSFNYAKLDSCILPSNYSFTNTSTGGNSYLWSFDTIANSIQNNPFFSFNDDGIYQVSVLATNSLGCSDSAIDYINVSPIPIANFSLDTTIGCEPFNAIFTNNSQYSNFYNWDFNDGNTGSFLNGSHVFQNSGNYTVKLVVEDVNGCKDSIFENVNVYPSPVSNYTYTATDPCYLPINVDFSNTSTGGNSFQWDFGNGQLTTFTNPSTIYDSIGIYNIQLITGNSYNCYDTLNNTFDVFYNQVPNALLNFDESICLRDTSFLYSNSLFADSLIWDLGNGVRLNGDTISFVFDSVGQYDITLFAYNLSSGCSDTSQGNNILEILPSPIADFELNQIQSYEPLSGSIEFINNSIDADTYLWSFNDVDTSYDAFPTYYYSYDYDGTYYYTLYAFSSNQCVDSLTKELYIEYKKALYVPNALYPSAANYEVSRFIPKGTGMKKYKVEIFDLFGNVIWESTALDDEGQPTESWNGQFNGVDVEPDVYVWKIEAQFKDDSFWDGQKPIEETILRKTGTLTVIR
ncbi:PKD domain-containing protein [Flavobacteriales bacterium]|nr:PKD domain-containing protein [Flavobacteriales bacterium]